MDLEFNDRESIDQSAIEIGEGEPTASCGEFGDQYKEVAPGVHVLVADDEESVREFTVGAVEQLIPGATINESPDGSHAVRAVEIMTERFGLRYMVVVSDQMMPVLTGMDLYTKIRQTPGMEETPFVLTSGYMSPEHRQVVDKTLESDPRFGFVKKPFGVSDLTHAINQVIKK